MVEGQPGGEATAWGRAILCFTALCGQTPQYPALWAATTEKANKAILERFPLVVSHEQAYTCIHQLSWEMLHNLRAQRG